MGLGSLGWRHPCGGVESKGESLPQAFSLKEQREEYCGRLSTFRWAGSIEKDPRSCGVRVPPCHVRELRHRPPLLPIYKRAGPGARIQGLLPPHA